MRHARDRVDGVLLLDKPGGASSNAVLQRAKRLLNAAKAGHTGTLDPLASGLLPICFGEATKFAQALLDSRKEYLATMRFGVATTTGDADGEVTGRASATVHTEDLMRALRSFVGVLQQVPPAYSALKFRGRNHYEYARSGIDVPRPARTIRIDTLELVEHRDDHAVLRVGCSKGTYIRTLVEDIASSLGTLAHVAGLRRLATGSFRIEQARSLDEFEGVAVDARRRLLLPIDAPLSELPELVLADRDAQALRHGREVRSSPGLSGRLRAYDARSEFVGLVEAANGLVRAARLVAHAEPRPVPAPAGFAVES